MIQNQYFRSGNLRLWYQSQDEARLVHLFGPETNPFHAEMGALREAYYFDLSGGEWGLFKRFFAFPARGQIQRRQRQRCRQPQSQQSPTVPHRDTSANWLAAPGGDATSSIADHPPAYHCFGQERDALCYGSSEVSATSLAKILQSEGLPRRHEQR